MWIESLQKKLSGIASVLLIAVYLILSGCASTTYLPSKPEPRIAPASLLAPPRPLELLPTDTAVDDAVALEVITRNNRACVYENEKLKTLQDWVKLPLKDERK